MNESHRMDYAMCSLFCADLASGIVLRDHMRGMNHGILSDS